MESQLIFLLRVQLALSTPLFASPLLSFALSAFSLDRDNSAFASHREQSQGGRAKFSVNQALQTVHSN